MIKPGVIVFIFIFVFVVCFFIYLCYRSKIKAELICVKSAKKQFMITHYHSNGFNTFLTYNYAYTSHSNGVVFNCLKKKKRIVITGNYIIEEGIRN